ncbi:hypothetical protein BAUCODRAFT_545711 [Baudoinia panamericana UAMH 10762]|uniref:Uncharacterized protein n=1 Tax=Baudoinia panamericana (strain UAMH 10762) TaxID=717646 RepID=M2N6F6_BAUPA|nr:uncharacterized protein BAUCODRAFT_545711 [Baudoinia panamericana UAMH 10762]EMC94360.1 hypothetical protein BAUCODRAFT_545711 [Baudoinia panamericana UAMH 10762]
MLRKALSLGKETIWQARRHLSTHATATYTIMARYVVLSRKSASSGRGGVVTGMSRRSGHNSALSAILALATLLAIFGDFTGPAGKGQGGLSRA